MKFAMIERTKCGYWILLAALTLVVTSTSGCMIGYRNHSLAHRSTMDGTTVEVEGDEDVVGVSAVADFRFVRVSMPLTLTRQKLTLTDTEGGVGGYSVDRELRHYRVDAPLVSFWSTERGLGLAYPGLLEHRSSVELWGGAESNLLSDGASTWFDAGLAYYAYNLVAIRVFAGWGSVPFRAATTSVGEVRSWTGRVSGPGIGVSITLGAGEHLLDFVKFLLDLDARQSKIFSGQSPD